MLLVPVRLAPSPIHGLGLFTTTPLPAGTVVWRFDPRVDQLHDPDLRARAEPTLQRLLDHFAYRCRWDDGHERIVLCADEARYMNHSDDPSLDENAAGDNVTRRDLAVGEELTCDYRGFDLDWPLKLSGAPTVTDGLVARGRYLELRRNQGWEFVHRPNARAVVGVIARTPDARLILVEQHRIPLGCAVIELPAGLVGDDGDHHEALELAAARELEEETGWRAARCRTVNAGPSSAGLTDEVCHLVVAEDLSRCGPGGGIDGENITVHEVPLVTLPAWLAERAAAGQPIDHKVHAALWWLSQA